MTKNDKDKEIKLLNSRIENLYSLYDNADYNNSITFSDLQKRLHKLEGEKPKQEKTSFWDKIWGTFLLSLVFSIELVFIFIVIFRYIHFF